MTTEIPAAGMAPRRCGPRRSSRWHISAVAAIGIVAFTLAGCTGGSSGAPAAPVMSQSSTSASASATDGNAGGTSTGSPTPTAISGSGQASAAAGPTVPVITTVVGGSTVTITPKASDILGDVTSHAPGAADAALAQILPGAYGLNSLGASARGASIDITTAESCVFVLDVLRSGQWGVTEILTPHDVVQSYLAVLSRGDREALVSLTESANACTGTITTETAQTVKSSGTVSVSGTAQAVTVSCVAQMSDDSTTPPANLVAVSYRIGSTPLFLMATVPAVTGSQPVTDDGPTMVVILDPAHPTLTQAATMMKVLFDPSAVQSEAGLLPGMTEQNTWLDEAATVTVTSTDPLVGTITAPHLVRETGGGTVGLSATFGCDKRRTSH